MTAKQPFRSGGWGDPRDFLLCFQIADNPDDIKLYPLQTLQ